MSKTHLLRVNETIVKQGQKVHRTAKKNIGEFDFSYEEVRNGLPVLNQFSSDFSLRRVLQVFFLSFFLSLSLSLFLS